MLDRRSSVEIFVFLLFFIGHNCTRVFEGITRAFNTRHKASHTFENYRIWSPRWLSSPANILFTQTHINPKYWRCTLRIRTLHPKYEDEALINKLLQAITTWFSLVLNKNFFDDRNSWVLTIGRDLSLVFVISLLKRKLRQFYCF